MPTNDRTIYAVVNIPSEDSPESVGAMEWRENQDDLPTFGEGDQRWRINLPSTLSDTEVTDALDFLLGDYDAPEGWETGPIQ